MSLSLPESLDSRRERLLAALAGLESCLVAFSGGVDSAVVAQAAGLALGERTAAAIGVGAALAEGELEAARDLAGRIGLRLIECPTDELARDGYRENSPHRCYHCKTELYERLGALAADCGFACVASGANVDDLQDYRPGLTAAAEHRVRHPLAECGLTKADVRELAAAWGLPVWDKPATPCLASRIAYGEEVTPERLAMIDRAEQRLRELGLREVRVRYHRGDLARLEVPAERIPDLCRAEVRACLAADLHALGFRFVALDLDGFRSGSLNALVPLALPPAVGETDRAQGAARRT